ncbi:MAG: winged helix-turn-helix domain-containing protein [Xanthomonadales bacterium]|nr:winged helix-turn-helix domain-containing protein [Xanthomonadales bacterium]
MARHVHHFHDCRIDVASRELHRGNVPVPTSPTVFDCIAYLLDNRQRAVGRDELVAAVWGRTTVTDAVLGKALLKARRAVGDSGEEQRIIRTVPRFGFHWVADVTTERIEVDGAPAPGPESIARAGAGSPQTWRSRIRVASLTCALGAAVAALLAWQGDAGDTPRSRVAAPVVSPSAVQPASRLAILPVEIAADPADAWLRLGLMDLVASRLRDGGVAVVPSDSVVRAVGAKREIDDDTLRIATGAGLVVGSQLHKTDAAWLLRMVLSDATGHRREVLVEGGDPLAVARDAADRIMALLGKTIPRGSLAAAELPLVELLQRIEASMLAGDVATAERLIETAPPRHRALPELQLRSAQADYWAGRIEVAYGKLSALRTESGFATDAVLRARMLSNLGSSARHLGDWAAADSAFDEAIALLDGHAEPVKSGQLRIARGLSYAEQGRYSEAVNDFSLARTVLQSAGDQFELAMVDYCEAFIHNHRNRPLVALDLFEKAAARFEEFGAITELASARSNQVVTERNLLRHLDALATSERGLSLLDRLQHRLARQQVIMARASALASVGRLDEARRLFADLVSRLDTAEEAKSLDMIRVEQASIELEAGEAEAAHALAREVSGKQAGSDALLTRTNAWLIVVKALVRMDRSGAARDQAEQFAAWADGSGDKTVVLYSRVAKAEATRNDAGHSAALHAYAATMQLAERDGVPIDLALVAIPYVRSLIAAGDLRRAGTVAGRISRYAEQDFESALLQVELYQAMSAVAAWRAALEHAETLAGERTIPVRLKAAPAATAALAWEGQPRQRTDPEGNGWQMEGKAE